MQEITLCGNLGDVRKVKAVIVGPFGIHRCGWGYSKGWLISHVATGFKMPVSFASRLAAIQCAVKLTRARSVRWDMDQPLPHTLHHRYQTVLKRAMRGLRTL